jgi:hypothetical protein
MALPKASDFDGPVKNPPVSGPAVDKIASRKEDNNGPRFAESDFDASFDTLIERVRAGTRRVLQAD